MTTRIWSKIATSFLLILYQNCLITSSVVQAQDINTVDTIATYIDENGVKVPDWSQISFANLPLVDTAGEINIPTELINQLGYNPNRAWEAGTAVADLVMMGDLNGFDLEEYSLTALEEYWGMSFDDWSLEEFDLIKNMDVGGLIEAYDLSGSAAKYVKDIPILQEALGSQYAGYALNVIKYKENLTSIALKEVNLAGYSISDISDLKGLAIKKYQNWQQSIIGKIPGIKEIPFSEYEKLKSATQAIGIVDIVFGETEQYGQQSISGSDVDGFGVNCSGGCAHVEFSGTPFVLGKRWISGDSQQVNGGKGILKIVNLGKEPTGRLPFNDSPFKLVLRNNTESEGSAQLKWVFRTCFRDMFGQEHCTPYCLFEIPIYKFNEGEWHYLGVAF